MNKRKFGFVLLLLTVYATALFGQSYSILNHVYCHHHSQQVHVCCSHEDENTRLAHRTGFKSDCQCVHEDLASEPVVLDSNHDRNSLVPFAMTPPDVMSRVAGAQLFAKFDLPRLERDEAIPNSIYISLRALRAPPVMA